MKRYLYYFTTMLLVFAITDYCLGGALFGLKNQAPGNISASLSGVKNAKELGELIASESCEFVQAAFSGDKAKVFDMLSGDTEYVVLEDDSSYIRYATGNLHVEGYMATDRELEKVSQNWYIIEDDGTITAGVEVGIEGEEACQIWYIHYRKSLDQWKIYMLENGI